ncbi:MAG: precorrin-2 dehydrogenase/sirohydrochlorin ferrochelatase family protein [Thermodesulfobacteriota bacterium]
MKYYPVFLNLQGKLCIVVGGGRVAERKVQGLLRAGAVVKVISPRWTQKLAKLKEQGKIIGHLRHFRSTDMKKAYLVIAATNDHAVNEKIYQQAEEQKILVNVVDDPKHSSFIVPALVKKGEITLAISTSGRSPALARFLRQKLEKVLGPEYAYLGKFLGRLRKWLFSQKIDSRQRQRIFSLLVGERSLDLIRQKKRREWERHLQSILGNDFSLKKLGIGK